MRRSDRESAPLTEVLARFGLEPPVEVEFLPLGTMNDNWRVRTARATYAVKRVRDVDLARMRRGHDVMARLADRGHPVPRTCRTPAGETEVEHGGDRYVLVEWVDGVPLAGEALTHEQAGELGHTLARLQSELATLGLPEEPPRDQSLPSVTPAREHVARYRKVVEAVAEPSEFDRAARAFLSRRHAMLEELRQLRPAEAVTAYAAGWSHGDFHRFNVLWSGGTLAGVVDWDRLQVMPLTVELVRAAVLTFTRADPVELDLGRITAFVAGYHRVRPLTERELRDTAACWWWKHLCSLFPLERHYDRGDHSADHLFLLNCRLLEWWAAHRGAVSAAFAAGLTTEPRRREGSVP